MIRKRRKRQDSQEENYLSEGILLKMDNFQQQENRAFTLVLKGILVYLIVMGAIGSLLSAVDVSYNQGMVHAMILLSAVFCSLLYYNACWENIGYFLLLAVMFLAGIGLRKYINSGFYAVANDLAEQASAFFESNAMRSFGEQISDRRLAVTVSMCYIGSVCCILMNILISRRMQYVITIPFSMGSLLMPLYLELEPSLGYAAMLLSGLLTAYIIRGNGHYRLTENNARYQFDNRKKRISYVYAGRVLAGVIAAVFLFCFVLIQLVGILYPKENFQDAHPMSKVKAQTMDTMENLSLLGIMGLLNFYPNTGGLTNGTLGGVSAVRLDYNTDLTVEFAPYSYDRIYLKTFTGAGYLPYSNRWSRLDDGQMLKENGIDTAKQLKKAYEEGRDKSARGKMKIKNVAAAIGMYLPYYTEEAESDRTEQIIYPGETKEYTYYPDLAGEKYSEKKNTSMEVWLEIPEQNQNVIEEFCKKAGFSGEPKEIIQQVIQYYQEEIPYTFRPGATPRKQDFINYFLEKNKKGYCAHFASAATLIFRYFGIPARYIEGYAIDAEDISEDGKVLSDKEYRQYYNGYSPLGETGVISIDVTDANAHAWVEVYDENQGWQVVEVTPYSGEEASDSSLWRIFMRFLGGGNAERTDADTSKNRGRIIFDKETRQVSRNTAFILSAVILIVLLGQWIVRKTVQYIRYHHAGRNERLVMCYQRYIHQMSKRRTGLRQKVNYRSQIQWLCEHHFLQLTREEQSNCVNILERAGFSNQEISQKEFEQTAEYFLPHRRSDFLDF